MKISGIVKLIIVKSIIIAAKATITVGIATVMELLRKSYQKD